MERDTLITWVADNLRKNGFIASAAHRYATTIVEMIPVDVMSNKSMLKTELLDISTALIMTAKNV